MCSGNAEIFCNALRRECRYHTWYKCCVIHHADTDDFHRKDGSGNRCAKQSGKTGAHAAHNHNTRVFVIKVQELGKKLPSEPPTCSAAPSRPAEPPQRCVSRVERIINGATCTGTSSLDWIAVMTRFVPVLRVSPASR